LEQEIDDVVWSHFGVVAHGPGERFQVPLAFEVRCITKQEVASEGLLTKPTVADSEQEGRVDTATH